MPLGFINLGFETGASPSGHMAGWSSVFFSSTFQFVGFGDTLETVSWEDFEHEWGGNDDGYFEFEPDNLVIAIYDLIPQPYEDFNSEWADGNQVHYIVMPGTILAAYDKVIYPDDIDYEPFEVGWESNEDDILLFAPGDTALASYDTVPEDFEDFGEEWDSNELDIQSFSPGDVVDAIYDEGGADELYEDFEEVDLILATIEITGAGADGDFYRIYVNNGPVEYESTGVGTLTQLRTWIMDKFNAEMAGVAVASPDGTVKMTLRSFTNGTSLGFSVETTGAAKMVLSFPDRTEVWTQLQQL